MVYLGYVTHYKHKNIVKGISNWNNKDVFCRNFDTLEEHDSTIIKNINSCVKENDILYFIGDWSFGNQSDILGLRNKLICKNIHIIVGNHDKSIMQKKDSLLGPDKFLTISHIKEIKIEDQVIVMSHYSMRDWNKAKEGSWMLHGHNHGRGYKYKKEYNWFLRPFKKLQYYKTMDVGIDCHPAFKPYRLSLIQDLMKTRINLNIEE